jgi:hypothetical protein
MKILVAVFLCAIMASVSCSVPNLEPAACTDAKLLAKEFYSQHFAGDMRNSADNVNLRAKFLTPELRDAAAAALPQADFFTTGDEDFPKAFRIGGCEDVSADRVRVEVLLFWRTDTRTEQRAIRVEMQNDSGAWKVNKIIR